VIEPGGRQIGDAAGELKGLRNAELERRCIIQGLSLFGDRGGNLGAAVTGIGASHARRGVDDLAAIDGKIVHVLGAGEEPRCFFEGPVGGEWHPMCGQIVGHIDGGGLWALVQHGGLFIWDVLRMGFSDRLSASPDGGNRQLQHLFQLNRAV
jgi:hypothetical protein